MKVGLAGATGLVGGACAEILQQESRVESIRSYGRRASRASSPKLRFVQTDFSSFAADGGAPLDAAICALGSTIRKAGSQQAFFQIDHDFVLRFAARCRELGVRKFVLVSAMGADADSRFFYNQVKGAAERDLKQIGFESLVILQPSLLLGERQESRFVEKLAITLTPLVQSLLVGPLKAGRPIEAKRVAETAVAALFHQTAKVELISNKKMLEGAWASK